MAVGIQVSNPIILCDKVHHYFFVQIVFSKTAFFTISNRVEIFSVQVIHFQDIRKKIAAINFARLLNLQCAKWLILRVFLAMPQVDLKKPSGSQKGSIQRNQNWAFFHFMALC